MAVTVGPTQTAPTHHISLSDGTDTLGLILANSKGERDARGIRQSGYPRSVTRISQGVSGYSDFELPYSPQVQSDFSGGRGLEDLERDTTRFYDSYRADTTRGDIVCGPKATATTTPNVTTQTIGTDADTYTLTQDTGSAMASKFTASGNYTMRSVTMKLSMPTTNEYGMVCIYSDHATNHVPDTLLASASLNSAYITGDTLKTVIIPLTLALTSGTVYWVAVQFPASSLISFEISSSYDPDESGNSIYIYNAGAWNLPLNNVDNQCLYFVIKSVGPGSGTFFEYRGNLYYTSKPDDRSAPVLLMNGYHGMALANGTQHDKLLTGLDLTGVSLAGAVVRLVAGPGSEETQNWRSIIGNTTTGTNDTISVYPPWNVTHTTATEYAITATNNWSEVTGHGLTKAVTDVMVLDDMVFFAQGEDTTLRRGRMASGTWAWYYDGTNASTGNKASYIRYITDVQGKKRVWRALAQASSVSYAAKPTWAASDSQTLTFKTDVICGTTEARITGIEEYGTPLTLYVLKEDGFGSIGGTTDSAVGVYAEHPLSAQLKNVRSEFNGKAHMRYNLFLYFSLLDGLESHFDQRIDDVGPNRDEGLMDASDGYPRKGPVSDLVPYAGRFYAAIDGGDKGYSCVLCCTRDNSWHEIYRGAYGQRIRKLAIQTIPGEKVDRLWISEEETIYWVPLAVDPAKQDDYTYFSGAQVITSWIYSGFKDVNKYFHSLTLFTEDLSGQSQYITAAYRVDDETAWTNIATNYTGSPVQTINLSASNNVSGKRIQFRFTLTTTTDTVTPRIKAFRVDSVVRLKPKKMWSVTYFVMDDQTDLTGETPTLTIGGQAATYNPENVLTLLDKWADSDQSPDPLTLRAQLSSLDSKSVFIEPTSISPLRVVNADADNSAKKTYMGSFTLLEA